MAVVRWLGARQRQRSRVWLAVVCALLVYLVVKPEIKYHKEVTRCLMDLVEDLASVEVWALVFEEARLPGPT